MHTDVRASIYQRRCFVCGESIPEGHGVVILSLRIRVCQGDCTAAVDQEWRDFSASRRGRWRPRVEVLRRLRALRALRQALAELAPGGSCA